MMVHNGCLLLASEGTRHTNSAQHPPIHVKTNKINNNKKTKGPPGQESQDDYSLGWPEGKGQSESPRLRDSGRDQEEGRKYIGEEGSYHELGGS